MKAQLARVHWNLVLMTAVLIYVLTLLLGLALSVPLLIFFDGGQWEAQRAIQASAVFSAFLVVVVTGAGAFWVARTVARTVERGAWLHGFLVGLIVALISCLFDLLFRREIRLVGLALYALMVLAGWLGGILGARWRRPLVSRQS